MSDELRALAEAATPGPWRTWNDGHVGCEDGGWVGGIFQPTHGSNPDQRMPDALFAAAANPTAVLALLDELNALRGAVERVRALADDACDCGNETCVEWAWGDAIRDALDGPA